MRVAQLMEHLAKLDPDADIAVYACYPKSHAEYYREDPQLVSAGDGYTLVGTYDLFAKVAAVKHASFPTPAELSAMLKVEDFEIWRA